MIFVFRVTILVCMNRILSRKKTSQSADFRSILLYMYMYVRHKTPPLRLFAYYIVPMTSHAGSMGGDRIENARKALLKCLDLLPADCYFNVVSFGSDYNTLFQT